MEDNDIDCFDLDSFKLIHEFMRTLQKPSMLLLETSSVSCFKLDDKTSSLVYGARNITSKFDLNKDMRVYRRNRKLVLLNFEDVMEVVDEYVQDIYVRVVKSKGVKVEKYNL